MKLPISPYPNYCIGYQNPEIINPGYVMGLVIGVGKAEVLLSHEGSQVLDSTVAFDRAEVEGTNLGQINMITVSSFCGPQGKMWGMDIAISPDLYSNKLIELDGVPVYSARPLLEASKKLFGTVAQPIFPLLPGSHVPCASKNITLKGPSKLYTAIGMGVPKDRGKSACLMMEDVGQVVGMDSQEIVDRMAKSILLIGENQHVRYKEIFVDYKTISFGASEVGCALVAAPYFALAKNAVQNKDLSQMSITEWEKML